MTHPLAKYAKQPSLLERAKAIRKRGETSMTIRKILDRLEAERMSHADAIRRLDDAHFDNSSLASLAIDEIAEHKKAIVRLEKFKAEITTAAQLAASRGEGKCHKKKRTAA